MGLAGLLGGLLESVGFGGQVVVAAGAGIVAWYLVKSLRVFRRAGGVIDTAIKFLAFGVAFVAAGALFGWFTVDPGAIAGTGMSLARLVGDLIGRFGDDAWRLVMEGIDRL